MFSDEIRQDSRGIVYPAVYSQNKRESRVDLICEAHSPIVPDAHCVTVIEMGLDRDGFRNRRLVINARMGSEEAGWTRIYHGEFR